jgi:deoxycytidine triphosphate deaminase
MSILSDKDINKIINKKDIVIYPFEKKCLTAVGYDLRIGIIKPLTEVDKFFEDDQIITIPPKSYCLVITEEFIWLSKKYLGTLHSRGTLAAKGLYTNSTNVDPNFKGQMIMSVYNASEVNIILDKKEKPTFITLIIHQVRTNTEPDNENKVARGSTRVLTQMLNEVYNDEISHKAQIKSINQLLYYMNSQSHENFEAFYKKISDANTILNPFIKEKIAKIALFIKNIFTGGISNIISLLAFSVVIYFLCDWVYNKYYQNFEKNDSRVFILLLVALVSLWDKVKKK